MKFYKKDWFIILMLFLCPPVGLFLMWKYSKCHKTAKIIISVLLIAIVIVILSFVSMFLGFLIPLDKMTMTIAMSKTLIIVFTILWHLEYFHIKNKPLGGHRNNISIMYYSFL